MTTLHRTLTFAPTIGGGSTPAIRVLCVDDNPSVSQALKVKFERAGSFVWVGALSSADELIDTVERSKPDVLILDIDMTGPSPLAVLADLVQLAPTLKTVIFSGHVSAELVTRALDAGAWGYVTKTDGEDTLLQAVQRVMNEEVALGPEARAAYSA